MVVADRTCHLPRGVLVLPDGYELRLADTVLRVPGMAEPVDADLDSSIAVERIDLQGTRHKRPFDLSTDILLARSDEGIFAHREACFVVIRLEIVRYHRT